MKIIKTARQLIKFGIELHENNDVPEGFIVCVHVDKKDRERIYSDLLDYDIDTDYIYLDGKKKGYHDFLLIGIRFHLF